MCAMKVTTDACIQGAWTPIGSKVKKVLDIGTGTGLLSLMLAQRNETIVIDSIESNKDASMQAKENITASPWNSRLYLIEGDARTYNFNSQYHLIITNPPFFSKSLLGPKDNKNQARHAQSLTSHDLLQIFDSFLIEGGYISILLPTSEFNVFEPRANEKGYFVFKKLSIKHSELSPVNRVVALLRRSMINEFVEETLIIKGDDDNYTNDFNRLLGEFYLNL